MRCFIGIDLSSSAIKEIERLQNIIEPHFIGKITESNNLHLTLKFLGEIDNDNSLADIFEKEWIFMGHITIARIKNLKNKNSFLELINKTKVNKIVFIIKEFYLKESILQKEGPVYKVISRYRI